MGIVSLVTTSGLGSPPLRDALSSKLALENFRCILAAAGGGGGATSKTKTLGGGGGSAGDLGFLPGIRALESVGL